MACPRRSRGIYETIGEIDGTALLPQVRVPTRVLHARDAARVPFEAGRRMAAGIPRARFVELQGDNPMSPVWARAATAGYRSARVPRVQVARVSQTVKSSVPG
jgi:pimeloyl-ACP methyl ester carboxylesterase